MPPKSLQVNVYFSSIIKKEPFQGRAVSISSENDLGDFDVLKMHSNFISLIYNQLTIRTESGKKLEYEFERGVMKVKENEVSVFLGL